MGFWDNTLGSAVSPAPKPSPQVTMPSLYPPTFPVAPQASVPQPLADPVVTPIPDKARSARLTERCPDCGSGNFFRPNGVPNAMEQCYECGYNPRFSHSTAGAGMPSDSSAPARPSRQVSTANNFNPQTIVATVK